MNGMEEMAESLAFLRRTIAKYFPEWGSLMNGCEPRWWAAARSARSTLRPRVPTRIRLRRGL